MNSKQFLTVVIITFVVGMVWLIADILFNTKASIPISDKLQSSLEPITPTFNARVLEVIQNETLSSNDIKVEEGSAPVLNIAEPEVAVEGNIPLASSSPSPTASASPVSAASPSPSTNPNLTPLIQLSSPSPSTSPVVPTP